jgi:predicted nucleotidyltransferase
VVLPSELKDLPSRYVELLDRTVATLGADDRVRAIWVSGSWARGEGDEGSDLDLVVATTGEGYDSIVASARQWWDAITPTVLLETVPHAPNVWYSVAPDGCRLDIVIEKESDLPRSIHRHRLPIVDPNGLSDQVPPAPSPSGPDPGGVEWRLKELFRALCLLKVLVARQDWLLGVQGCALMQRTLADLYSAANGTLSTSGVKHYSSRLSAEQRAALEALPPIAPTRESVIAGHLALLEAIMATVPSLAGGFGVSWPSRLESTARAQLEEAVTGRLAELGGVSPRRTPI